MPEGDTVIATGFNKEERERFHNLLTLAKVSEYEGERENALAAAKRLAAKHDMTLEEAAMSSPPQDAPRQRSQYEQATRGPRAKDFARHVHMMDYDLYVKKQQREEALAKARERGLDADERRPRRSDQRASRSKAKMNPRMHAWKLVAETSLPYQEIADITGLKNHEVVFMKIQRLRAA